MADNFDLANPEVRNALTIWRWLIYTGEMMESYTRERIKMLHQQIYTRLANLPVCCQRCSETQGRLWQQWCPTCEEWRSQLLTSHRRQDIAWEKTKSWLWPTNYECVAEVFSNLIHGKATSPNFNDLTFLCSVWENCVTEFSIQRKVISTLREQRNKFFHRAKARIAELEKQKLFSVLCRLFNDGDVKLCVDSMECEEGLKSIEADRYPDQGYRLLLQKLEETSRNDQNKLIDLERQIKLMNVREQNRKKNLKRILYTFTIFIISILVIASVILLRSYYPNIDLNTSQEIQTPAKLTGCVDENYIYPFPQDFPQLEYISGHNDFIGRKWLIDDIERIVLHNINSSGLLLVADIGYGKTAISSHIICAKEGDRSRSLRDHTVGFQVCRFDVETSKSGGRFIRRLIGFLSTKSAEFGSIISHLSNASIMFSKDQCEQEQNACFDQGILFPLKRMETPIDSPWLIVIDALDECIDSTQGENRIVDILSRGLKKIPRWVKFIITSRHSAVLVKLKHLSQHLLKSNDTKNLKDISFYLSEKINDEIKLKNIMKISQGNFQFVKHVMLHSLSGSFNTLPQTLAEIYEADFERQFISNLSFELSKNILEIVCATISPLTKQEVLSILQNNVPIVNDQFTEALEKMSYYVASTEHGYLVFVHQSIAEWLQSGESGRFTILIENGHQAISSFMVDLFNTNKSLDLVNLAIHVAASSNNTLTKLFRSIARNVQQDVELLHRLVWRTDSVEALKLLLPICKTIDALNYANVTPAFIASAQGHVDQLKLLGTYGANLNFVTGQKDVIYSHTEELIDDVIALHKDVYYTGYSLLHIASKRGHFTTVNYLLTLNQSIINETTAIGLRASDLACGEGNLDILEAISKIDPSVLDRRCFYQASKYNQLHVLKYIVSNNANISCITVNESVNAFSMLFNDSSLSAFQVRFSNYIVSMSNIANWWIAFGDSPLHVTLKNNNYNTFNYIAEHFPHLLVCTNILGYTPTLYSIVANTTDVSNQHIKSNLPHDRCTGLLDRTMYSHVHVLLDEPCEVNSTAAHIIARFNRFEIGLKVLNNGITIKWNTPDSSLQMPIHYACAKDHFKILHILKRVNVDFINTKTKGNMTATQISSTYGSVMCFHTIILYFSKNAILLKDMENRSILYYNSIREFKSMTAEDDFQESFNHGLIFQMTLEYDKNIVFAVDKDGRNVMHYALRHGHYYTLDLLVQKHESDLWQLLTMRDLFNQTAFQFALAQSRTDKKPFFVPSNCSFVDMFTENCNLNARKYLDSWELGLAIIVQRATFSFTQTYIVPELCQILHLSPYLSAALFTYHRNNLDKTTLQFKLLECLRLDIHPLAIFVIARHRPDILRVCGRPLAESPLHLMTLNSSVFQLLSKFEIRILLELTFYKHDLLGCTDNLGYNVFHYALKASNPTLAATLLDLGVLNVVPKKNLKDIVRMLLFHQNTGSNLSVLNMDSYITFDDVLLELFSFYPPHTISENEICNNGSRQLSLIHFIAVNGFTKTIQYINTTYGKTIISCMNHDRITPLYLTKLFNHTECVSFLERITSLSLPKPLAEIHLLFNVQSGFPFSSTHIEIPLHTMIYILTKNETKFPWSNVDHGFNGPNPLICLNNNIQIKHGQMYKQLRMVRCIKHVVDFCKTKQIKDAVLTHLLSTINFSDHLDDLKSRIIKKSSCKYSRTLDLYISCINISSGSKRVTQRKTLLYQLKIFELSKVFHLKHLNTLNIFIRNLFKYSVVSLKQLLELSEKLAVMYLELLREAALQISIRTLNSLWINDIYQQNNDFLSKRIKVLSLLTPLNQTKVYVDLMYNMSLSLESYRYQNVIGRLNGFIYYRKLNIDFADVNSRLAYLLSSTDHKWLSVLQQIKPKKYGEKVDPFRNT